MSHRLPMLRQHNRDKCKESILSDHISSKFSFLTSHNGIAWKLITSKIIDSSGRSEHPLSANVLLQCTFQIGPLLSGSLFLSLTEIVPGIRGKGN